MVEFIYCGETTIPHQLLLPLLTAKKTFKIKALSTVINTMASTSVQNFGVNMDNKDTESNTINDTSNSANYVYTQCNELTNNECFIFDKRNNTITNSAQNGLLEFNKSNELPEQELKHMLYEESQDFGSNVEQTNTLLSLTNSTTLIRNSNTNLITHEKVKSIPRKCHGDWMMSNETPRTNKSNPVIHKQHYDVSNINESEEYSTMSQPGSQENEKDFMQYKFEGTDVPSKVGKCVKVYTHKKRKSADEIKTKLTYVSNITRSPSSNNCIDLLDEPSIDDIPVTLLTSLDMESAEYIISLSTENIQSIVETAFIEQEALNTNKEIEQIFEYDIQNNRISNKRSSTENTVTPIHVKPTLRRSLRLHQQDVEETTNNNEIVKGFSGKERQFKKSNTLNKTEVCIKKKRKVKNVDYKIEEQRISNEIQTSKKILDSSRKNSAKLIVKKNSKCAISEKGKGEDAAKMASKLKSGISQAAGTNPVFDLAKLNTIKHTSRALWGDMADFPEMYENKLNTLEYASNAEIPFAVGLLPLRTALEKMQATPDYQPRKTRSSMASVKQDTNYFRRKSFSQFGKIASGKQSNYVLEPKENAKAVCHIQIRTAPPHYVRSHKKYLAPDVMRETPTLMNKH